MNRTIVACARCILIATLIGFASAIAIAWLIHLLVASCTIGWTRTEIGISPTGQSCVAFNTSSNRVATLVNYRVYATADDGARCVAAMQHILGREKHVEIDDVSLPSWVHLNDLSSFSSRDGWTVVNAVGWPSRNLFAVEWQRGGAWVSKKQLDCGVVRLPVGVVWCGMIIDIVFYGAISIVTWHAARIVVKCARVSCSAKPPHDL